MEVLNELLQKTCSTIKLERDRGQPELEKYIGKLTTEERYDAEELLINLLCDSESRWEVKQGCLLGAKTLIPLLSLDDERDHRFLWAVKDKALNLLTDDEARVSLSAGDVLGHLCSKIGTKVYQESKETILNQIHINLDDSSVKVELFENHRLVDKLPGDQRRYSSEAAQIFQDSSCWKNLEKSLKALQAIIEGSGSSFQQFIDEELLCLVFKTLKHPSCFVRETGFYVCSSLVNCAINNEDAELSEGSFTSIYVFASTFATHLANGLADDWSQVRLAASVATRSLLLTLPGDNLKQSLFPLLLPRICLNRYYMADGVRIYSQETWRQVAGARGKELVQIYIEPTVDYYISAASSDNHAIREAACACIAELATKVDPECVVPYVERLLATLLKCSRDGSWPVRDAACLACGSFFLSHPEASKKLFPSLYPMFCANLADAIPSVRQGAANALGNVVRAFGDEALHLVMEEIEKSFENMKSQPSDCEIPGDVTLMRNGMEKSGQDVIGMNKPTYRCEPGGEVGGCEGQGQVTEPWAMADGCAYLLTELSVMRECHVKVVTAIPMLISAARLRHYGQHHVLLETVCKQIPILAKNLGKPLFKPLLDDMLDVIFLAMECENALTCSAASQCLSLLASFLGHNVLRARVNNFNPRHLHHFESALYVAPL